MLVYLDESGDMGWTFHKPFRKGGSSRYLAIACLIIPPQKRHLPQRLVRKLYRRKHHPPGDELKGKDLTPADKHFVAVQTVQMLTRHPDIQIITITTYKPRVEEHIRSDANKLYNYMIRLALIDHLKIFPEVMIIPDKRSIKLRSGNSLEDYLQIHLWVEQKAKTRLTVRPEESSHNLLLQFIDYIANITWKHHEDHAHEAFSILSPLIIKKHLFFPHDRC